MSIFDLTANDMRASFADAPDLTPYAAVEPRQDITELVPPVAALEGEARKAALAPLQMEFSVPDAAPSEKLNRIIWHSARGWTTPYPAVQHALFPHCQSIWPTTIATSASQTRKRFLA
jgi:hypothetical protein